jgi:hypothetical protein
MGHNFALFKVMGKQIKRSFNTVRSRTRTASPRRIANESAHHFQPIEQAMAYAKKSPSSTPVHGCGWMNRASAETFSGPTVRFVGQTQIEGWKAKRDRS